MANPQGSDSTPNDPASNAELSDRQAVFVDEYFQDLNATQAAIRAGYSEKSARVTGQKLMRNPRVKEVIQERRRARAERLRISADRILAELAVIAFSDISNYVTAFDGTVLINDLKTVPPHLRAAIAKVSSSKEGVSIQLHSKESALVKLARHVELPGF